MVKVVKNESGFGAVEIFLLLVIAAVMVFMGVYVLRADKTIKVPTSSSTPTPTVAPTQNTTVIKPSTSAKDLTIQKITYDNTGTPAQLEIKKQLYDFYSAWNLLISKAAQFDEQSAPTRDTYLTKAAQQQQKDNYTYDLYICSQMRQESIVIGNPVINGISADVMVTPTEINMTKTSKPIKLSLIKQNSKWFINHVTCSF